MARGAGPLGRLLRGLADTLLEAVLELGTPGIRAWLQGRLGPRADVDHVNVEGTRLTLVGVRVPLAAGIVLTLDRVVARAFGATRSRLPSVRVVALHGELVARTRAGGLAARLAFVERAAGESGAWLDGELTVIAELPDGKGPVSGRVDLCATSSAWRCERGLVERGAEHVRFAADGSLVDRARALERGGLAFEGVRLASLASVLEVITGCATPLPAPAGDAVVSGDAELDERGVHDCRLHVASELGRLEVTGSFAKSGAVDARVTGVLSLLATLRASGVASAVLPREDDVVDVMLDVRGSVAAPSLDGEVRAPSLGLRPARARWMPPLVASDVAFAIGLSSGALRLRGGAKVGHGALALDLALEGKGAAGAAGLRGELRVRELDARSALGLAAAAGALDHGGLALEGDASRLAGAVLVPPDARLSADLTLDAGHASGRVEVATPRSSLVLMPVRLTRVGLESARLSGELAVEDALTLGLLPRETRPRADAPVHVDLAITGAWAEGLTVEGRLSVARLALDGVASAGPIDLVGVEGRIRVAGGELSYDAVRARAFGGELRARGTVPLGPSMRVGGARPPHLALDLHECGPALLEAIGPLVSDRVRWRASVAAQGRDRHVGDVHLPADTRVDGEVCVTSDGQLVVDVTVATELSSLAIHVRRSRDARLEGTSIRGWVAVADVLALGVVEAPLDPSDVLCIEAGVSGHEDAPVAAGFATADRLRVRTPAATFELHGMSMLFRTDGDRLVWNDLQADLLGGRVWSAGVAGLAAPFTALRGELRIDSARLEHLALERGPTLPDIVCGRLSLAVRLSQSRPGAAVLGRGRVRLDAASFPALRLARPALARYGLVLAERAVRPVTADVLLDADGLVLEAIQLSLEGCATSGSLRVSAAGTLDGGLVVTLGERLLAASPLLALPSALLAGLELPVRVRGTFEAPVVEADLAASLGRFVEGSRVSAIVVERAGQLLARFGAEPLAARTRDSIAASSEPREGEDDATGARGVEWEALRLRLARARRRGQ